MPRRKAPQNTFWRGKILWARVKVKGHDQKWSLRTDDPEVASARVKEERKRLIAAAYYGDDRKLFEDVADAWAEHHIAHSVAASTARRYASSLAVLTPFVEGKYLDQVDRSLVATFVQARRDAKVSTATIRRDLTALSSILEYAMDEGLREEGDNPALTRLKRLKERRDPIVLPEQEDIWEVISKAPTGLAAMISAAWKTGCRQNELVTAERMKLDHQRRQLTVIGKRNKVRTIDLEFGDAYEVLRGLPAHIGCRWLFWHGTGQPYRNVASRFRAIVMGAQKVAHREGRELRPFRFHDLRHRHAVDWLKSGRSIYDLQQRLGHNSIKTTEMYLAFLTPEEQRVAKQQGTQTGEHVQRFTVEKA